MVGSDAMRLLVKLGIAGFMGIMLAATVTPGIRSSAQSNFAAEVYLPNQQLDFGVVTFQEERQVSFTVLNTGKRRLVINEVNVGCGCGEPVLRTVVIPPGGAGELIVSIDTRFITGATEKSATFTTNDTTLPRFELLVKASVYPAEKSSGWDEDLRGLQSVLITRQV